MAAMNAENESSRLQLDFGSALRFTFHSVRTAFAWKSRLVVLAPLRGDYLDDAFTSKLAISLPLQCVLSFDCGS
jgi:hypothetical protein